MTPNDRQRLISQLTPDEVEYLSHAWEIWARPKQLPPPFPWKVWLLMAGRGFGKTRAGAEWIRAMAQAGSKGKLALVGETSHDVRHVMIEGPSGILSITPAAERPDWFPSQRLLRWPNGATARCYSASEPDQLRGPEMEFAWCDEIAKWPYESAWDNMMMGLRIGAMPRVVATTTPRPRKWLIALSHQLDVVVTRGSSYENAPNLAPGFLDTVRARYGSLDIGRQELEGFLLEEYPDALWNRTALNLIRRPAPERSVLTNVVIGIDPALGGADQTGIIVAGRDTDGCLWVLEDASLRAPPNQWARRIAQLSTTWRATRLVAEVNQGGNLVTDVLRSRGIRLPIQTVRARQGKALRAEPVAAAYAEGQIFHAGRFDALEDEMCACVPGEKPTASPDRLDAGTWTRTPAKGGAVVLRQEDDGDTVTTAASAGQEYRVLMVREMDNHRLEISAIRYDGGLYDRVEKNLTLDTSATAGLPQFDDPLPAATGLSLSQPGRLPEGGSGRDLHVGWTPPTDARIAFWRLNATGPDGELGYAEVSSPPAILRSLAPGEWTCRLVAVDWTGREGHPASSSVSVKADPISPEPPQGAGLAAGYGQLTLIWSTNDLPDGAAVEVLEYASPDASDPVTTSRVLGSMLILPDRTPGEDAYFRLRTRLKGGTVSDAGSLLSGAALAFPQPQDGERGTIMASAQVASPVWSNTVAATAITQITGDPPRPGDVVTLSASASSAWAETRRFTDPQWEVTAPILAGDQIAAGTLPASRLVLDETILKAETATDQLTLAAVPANLITSGVMQSTSYTKGQSGYRIDTAGKAEFYSAHIRGVLEGSRIESSLLISALQAIPTEAGGRFITLDVERPLRYYQRKKQNNTLTLGPIDIAVDDHSTRYGDKHKVVVAADDPVGDTSDGYNDHYARYWAFEPKIKVTASAYRSGRPWGQYFTKARVKAKITTQSGRVLAESKIMDLSDKAIWKHQTNPLSDYVLLPKVDGFRTGSYILITRSTAWENGTGSGRSYTYSLLVTMVLGARFSFAESDTEGDGLMMEFLLDFDGEGVTSNPIDTFFLTARLTGSTLD